MYMIIIRLNSTKSLLSVNMYFMNISKIIEIKQNEWEIFSTILRIKFQSKGQLLINNETSLNSRRTHKANILHNIDSI